METIFNKLYQGKYLTYEESKILFNSIVQRKIPPIMLIAVLISMKIRSESAEEIAGAADALLSSVKSFPKPNYLFADIVGTGGDHNSKSINISTASAIIASGCGVKIVKHGNYSISSITGSFNLLSIFGVDINMSAIQSRNILDNFGICFLLASKYHTSFHSLMIIRKKLNTSTIFNLLGPIINPSYPPIILIGVYHLKLLMPMAKALKILGYQRAAVVHGGGMDEVVLHANTHVVELCNDVIKSYILTPMDFGLKFQSSENIKGGLPKKNLNILVNLLKGKGNHAVKLVIAANVSLLLKLFGYENLRDNTCQALDEINSGNSYTRMMALIKYGK